MTKDEEALAEIGAHVRAEQAHDAELEEIARGGAPGVTSDDPELAAMAGAAKPLGAAFEERIAARVARVPVASPEPQPPPAPRPVSVIRRFAPWIGPVALAAAVLLLVVSRGAGEGGEGSLPDYAASVRGDQVMRGPSEPGSSSSPLRITDAASSFELVVRPAVAAPERVAAWVFTRAPGEDPSALDAEVDVSAEGAVRVRGTAAALGRADEVRVVVAPAGRTRYDDALARARSGASDANVRVVIVPIAR